jgi:hypothetical protein
VGSSASYAVEVARLLWPEPWEAPRLTRGRGRAGAVRRDAYVFPTTRRPRLLVPADLPGSSTMVRHLGGPRHGAARPLRRLLERSVRTGALDVARWPVLSVPGADAGADSIERHLSEALGTAVRVGVMLGTRRVNQKPVLPVFALDGRLLGYAKVGHNGLTASLVRREAEVLASLGSMRPRRFRMPELLHHGRWSGLEVLVQSPLTVRAGEPVPGPVREAASRELATLGGTEEAPLRASSYWRRLHGEVAALPDGPDRDRLCRTLAGIEHHHGDHVLTLGGSHGDWGHWNMGMADGTLLVWDWERYDARVPLGFDALHHGVRAVQPGQRAAARQQESFLGAVPGALTAAGVPARRHDLTLRLYLAEMAARYLEALTHGETAALRRRTSWVLSLLEELAGLPRPTSSEGRP